MYWYQERTIPSTVNAIVPGSGSGKTGAHAVIVPGHAILTDFSDPQAEDGWILLDFQRGETGCYVERVRRGVQLASEDSTSLLVFSGGQSRREAGPRSEAWSYFWIADRFGWLGKAEVASRATTEEFARDSFENLLFGICRFKECVGQYPERVHLPAGHLKRNGSNSIGMRFAGLATATAMLASTIRQ